MKILVTGGAGYIGSHTIIYLQQHSDHDLLSVDSYINSTPETYARIERITGKQVEHIKADLADADQCLDVFSSNKDIDGVIHFAALKSVGDSVENPELYRHNNNGSLKNVLQARAKCPFRYFVFSSSCSVYGNIEDLPVTEDTPLGKAESPYAETKQRGEEIIRQYAAASKQFKAVALRYFNPVGAHISGLNGELSLNKPNNLVPLITRTAAGLMDHLTVFGVDYPTRDGSCIRDYVHVVDIARAHGLALDYMAGQQTTNYNLFNLGTGNGVSVLEAINAFERITGNKLNYQMGQRREGDVAAIFSDCSKAAEELGWIPEFGLDEMMSSAWKWQQNPVNDGMAGH